MPAYKADKVLEQVAVDIINKVRQDLKHVQICYMFRDTAAITDDKVVAGMCIRVDDRNYTIHGFDFVIEIAKDVWDEADDTFRVALMDHELGHVGIRFDADDDDPRRDDKTDRVKTFSKRHDVEEFEDVLERHGAYHKALREFLKKFAERKLKEKKKKTDEDLDV